MKAFKLLTLVSMFLLLHTLLKAQTDTIATNASEDGHLIVLDFEKGPAHNYPLMAVWLEDMDSNYIETLYVAQSIGTGIFKHGKSEKGKWEPGAILRPAALPYWAHQRGVQSSEGHYLPTPERPVPDAITGPTPDDNFVLKARAGEILPTRFRVLFEINQSWDWNEYWNNSKYPDDREYKTSSQPSLVYEAVLNLNETGREINMRMTGHGHYSGKNGELYTDLTTLTTAKEIAEKISVQIIR